MSLYVQECYQQPRDIYISIFVLLGNSIPALFTTYQMVEVVVTPMKSILKSGEEN